MIKFRVGGLIDCRYGLLRINNNKISWGNKPHNWICLGDGTQEIRMFKDNKKYLSIYMGFYPYEYRYDIYFNTRKKNTPDYIGYVVFKGCKNV